MIPSSGTALMETCLGSMIICHGWIGKEVGTKSILVSREQTLLLLVLIHYGDFEVPLDTHFHV